MRVGEEESPMIIRLSFALLSLLFAASSSSALSLSDARITRTVSNGNVSVHFLRGGPGGAGAPLTLHQGVASGLAQVQIVGKQIMVSNAATSSLFVQAGTLLAGATQDQVVWQSVLVPPGAKVPLNTWCVEGERWTARPGTDATRYIPAQSLAPLPDLKRSRLAESGPDAAFDNKLRQFRVWLSIDALRRNLINALGTDSAADSSLAALTENPTVERAIAPTVAALSSIGGETGAIVMIGDRIAGAEAYASPELFAAQWPRLLRAYAIEALAAPPTPGKTMADHGRAEAFLVRARESDPISDGWRAPSSADARLLHRGLAGEAREHVIGLAPTERLVAGTLSALPPGVGGHAVVLAMLRTLHDQTDGSLAALRQATRQILAAKALPSVDALKELISGGRVRPATPHPIELPPGLGNLTSVLLLLAIGMVILSTLRRRPVTQPPWRYAGTGEALRRSTPTDAPRRRRLTVPEVPLTRRERMPMPHVARREPEEILLREAA
jgi:hypothetical protein